MLILMALEATGVQDDAGICEEVLQSKQVEKGQCQ